MENKTIEYTLGNQKFLGYLAFDPKVSGKRPAVLVVHAWQGQDDFAREKANALAAMGYVAFAADLYGNGIYAEKKEDAAKLMRPLFLDRAMLQERVRTGFNTMLQQPNVDQKHTGAIGFCFGGLTVIELLRSGAPVQAAVSFHAVLGNAMGGEKAKTVPIAKNISGSLLMLHGHADPLVSSDDIKAIQTEMSQANVDWQMHIYGHTKHAFTNPQAHEDAIGLVFNKKSSQRSWQSMQNFFNELF